MTFLIDSHIYLWLIHDAKPGAISSGLLKQLQNPNNTLMLSVASLWKLKIKQMKGTLNVPDRVFEVHTFPAFKLLPLTSEHIRALGIIDIDPANPIHRDPFDRIMLAQAMHEGMTFVTNDRHSLQYARPGFEVSDATST